MLVDILGVVHDVIPAQVGAGGDQRVTELAYDREGDRVVRNADTDGLLACREQIGRITSYNVCYTKLLRDSQALSIAKA